MNRAADHTNLLPSGLIAQGDGMGFGMQTGMKLSSPVRAGVAATK